MSLFGVIRDAINNTYTMMVKSDGSIFTNLIGRWGNGVDETDAVRIDASTNAIVAITQEHHEGHAGNRFFYKEVLTLIGGAGDIAYFMFTAPDTPEEIHADVFFAGASAEFDVYLFSAPTTTDDGTPIEFTNSNGNSATLPHLDAFAGPTIAAPAIDNEGDQFWHAKVGVGKSAGVSNGLNYEIIATRNTKYLFKIVKLAATTEWIDIDFFYYQHTPKN